MKILIITPRIPYPPYRGDKLKTFNISNELLKRNKVKIVSFLSNTDEAKDVVELQKKGFDIEVVSLPKIKSWLMMLVGFFSSSPLQVLYYSSDEMHKRIRELTSREKFDVVYFHLINSAQYFDSVSDPNSLRVLDFTDATSLYLKRYVDFLKNPFRKLIFKWEVKKVLKYESIAKKFDTLFVCSNTDKEFLLKRNVHSNIQLLLNGIDLDTFRYESTKLEKGRIIFAGNMSYFPNIDAVMYFAKDVFPLIQKRVPSAKFYIVGQQPPPKILSLQSEAIVVTGFVNDIRKEYLLSSVNVAPIRFGSGTLNKVIESLLLGVPTVATSLSINGSPIEIKKYVYVADTPEQFAEKVVQLILDNSDWKQRVEEAKRTTQDMLGWEKIVQEFEIYLQERMNIKKNI